MIRGLNKVTKAAGLGYMMSTYSAHPDGFEAAEEVAQKIAADLMLAGLVVFAPIAYAPGIERKMISGMQKCDIKAIQSHEFWMPIDERFFERCDYGLFALTPGWEKSTGAAIEVFAMSRSKKPVWFFDPHDDRILTMQEWSTLYPNQSGEFTLKMVESNRQYLSKFGEEQHAAIYEAVKIAGRF